MRFRKRDGWQLAGHCAVDAGLIMICDPCYVHKEDGGCSSAPFSGTWDDFCAWLAEDNYPLVKKMPFTLGHEGAGVVMSSGFGDGVYPVYVRIKDFGKWGKRVVEATILFDEDEE